MSISSTIFESMEIMKVLNVVFKGGVGGVSDEEIQQLFNMIDKDKSGTLSLRVFVPLLDFKAQFNIFKVQQ